MASLVGHWEIGGRNLDLLTAFCRRLFGWEAMAFDAHYRLVNLCDGIGGELMLPGVGAFALFRDPEDHTVGSLRPDA